MSNKKERLFFIFYIFRFYGTQMRQMRLIDTDVL